MEEAPTLSTAPSGFQPYRPQTIPTTATPVPLLQNVKSHSAGTAAGAVTPTSVPAAAATPVAAAAAQSYADYAALAAGYHPALLGGIFG